MTRKEELTQGVKYDADKARFDLLPSMALREVADIFTHGAKKYDARNWEKGMAWGRVFGALMRHLWAWWGGEELDPESGKSHLAHAAFGVLVLLEYGRHHRNYDDRSKLGVKNA